MANLNDDERLNLKKLVTEMEGEDNTHNIRRIKHSVPMRDDIRIIDTLKNTHADMRQRRPVTNQPKVALDPSGDAITIFEILGQLQDHRLARVHLDLVDEGEQFAFDRRIADLFGALVGRFFQRDRRRQQACVARHHGDEIGGLGVGPGAWIEMVERPDL